jgi:transmembrane sensor
VDKTNNIDELISKFLLGEASPEEAILLEDWKNKRKANLDYYNTGARLFNVSHKTVDSEKAWENIEPQLVKKRSINFTRRFLQIAATLLVLVGISTIIIHLTKDKTIETIAYYSNNTSKEITLDDNTEVSLAPNSSITIDEDFGTKNRVLHLVGSAYFSVNENDSEMPLLIDVEGVFIKDIGTKFNIRTSSDTDTVFVSVDEGIVIMFDSLGSEITIRASEKAIYIKSSREIKSIPILDVNKQFDFKNTKLTTIIESLNEAYDTHIVLSNKDLENSTITVSFNNEDIETVMMIITETLDLKYEKTKDGFIINEK